MKLTKHFHSQRALAKWHAMMARNFARIAANCAKRDFPDSAAYFEAKAKTHKNQAGDQA